MISADALLRRFYTLRYYRAGQIFARLAAAARKRSARARRERILRLPALEPQGQRLELSAPPVSSARLIHRSDRASLEILGCSVALSRPLDWQSLDAAAPTRLWRFHLHYHEFLENGLCEDSETDPAAHWEFIDAWIDTFGGRAPEAVGDAWHPYVISRRIPVWVRLFQNRPPPEPMRQRLVASLAAQARWLAENLEWDVRGNHLLQNLRGLAVAGAFFSGLEADGWLRRVGAILPDQLREQILPHGEHFERAPAYHIDMLLALADIRAAGRGTWASQLEEPIARMARFLSEIVHPDGQIPLFGDSTLDQYPAPQEVLAALGVGAPSANDDRERSGRVGEYWTFRNKGDYIIFDAGPVGPDHLPAHAHADLLTLEASWHGSRLFVDGGVADYDDTPERAFCRSTAAHNVMQIDGVNQCDVWSRFRMGRRGWPETLRFGQDGPFHWAWSAHNSYRFLGVPRVGRLIICIAEGPWIVFDWAEGRGVHRFVNRLRLGPDWNVSNQEGSHLTVTDGRESLTVQTFPETAIRCQPSRYYPLFGRHIQVIALEQEWQACPPFASGWMISRSRDETPAVEVHGRSVRVRWRGSSAEIDLG